MTARQIIFKVNAMNSVNSTQLQPELTKLGIRLRRLRHQRNWTLEALAKQTGISEAYLSRLEGGERQPSLSILFTLAGAYNVAISSLFEPEQTAESCVIVRAANAVIQEGQGLLYTPLSSGNRFTSLHPMRVTVTANRQGDHLYQHEGEEWLYVLTGQLQLTIEDEEYFLQPGDAAHFDGRTPHRLSSVGGSDVEIILVACAPPHPLRGSHS